MNANDIFTMIMSWGSEKMSKMKVNMGLDFPILRKGRP